MHLEVKVACGNALFAALEMYRYGLEVVSGPFTIVPSAITLVLLQLRSRERVLMVSTFCIVIFSRAGHSGAKLGSETELYSDLDRLGL